MVRMRWNEGYIVILQCAYIDKLIQSDDNKLSIIDISYLHFIIQKERGCSIWINGSFIKIVKENGAGEELQAMVKLLVLLHKVM